jgi:hypothetical protein
MSSFFSVDRAKRFLFICFALLAMAAVVTGCDTNLGSDTNKEGALPNALIGKWSTAYDYFEISRVGDTEFLSYYDGGYGGAYIGTIRYVSNYDSRSGLIIIQYNSGAPDSSKPFHAVYYLKFVPGTSVELNNTYIVSIPYPGNNNADTVTLAQAIAKFTRESMGNYMNFSYSTPYNKE